MGEQVGIVLTVGSLLFVVILSIGCHIWDKRRRGEKCREERRKEITERRENGYTKRFWYAHM